MIPRPHRRCGATATRSVWRCIPWVLLGACGAPDVPAASRPLVERRPSELRLEITTDAHLNSAADAQGLPTRLIVLQLREPTLFESSSFADLWLERSATLGDALLHEETLTALPNQQVSHVVALDPSTAWLAVVAIVRNPVGREWRSIAPVQASDVQDGRTLRIVGSRVEFSADARGAR